MPGIDARTGRIIDDWSHTQQSIATILSTPLGARVMRGWVGSRNSRLLGELLSPATIDLYFYLAVLAITLHEPRFEPIDCLLGDVSEAPDGAAEFGFGGIFRPKAHRGDFRIAEPKDILFSRENGLLTIAAGGIIR